MAAPVNAFIYFASHDLHRRYETSFEARSSSGGGSVLTRVADGELSAAVEIARAQVGRDPLGFVTSTEGDALEAIAAGADDAIALTDDNTDGLISFLDRVRVRALGRREGERRYEDFVQAEKLTALGTLIAGVGHELNNPLSTITLGFDVLRESVLPDLEAIWKVREKMNSGGHVTADELESLASRIKSRTPDVRELFNDLAVSTASVSQLVQDLRVFSRSSMVEQSSFFAAEEIIEQALRLVRREFGPKTVVEQDYEDGLPELYLPRNRLAQVLTNLLVNAAHATSEMKRDFHQVKVSARVDEEHLAISVSDTGPGIPERALEQIFDPFYTTKGEGRGTGLGLSISRSILQHLGGDLVVSSIFGEGATFLCFLPLPTPAQLTLKSSKRRPALSPPSDNRIRRSVLLIDDDEKVLRTMARSIRDEYKVLLARDGEEAMELLSSGSHADAIVMELDLPEKDGPSFHDWLLGYDENLARHTIIATAAQERTRFQSFLETSKLPTLHKPIAKAEILEVLGRVFDEQPPPLRPLNPASPPL